MEAMRVEISRFRLKEFIHDVSAFLGSQLRAFAEFDNRFSASGSGQKEPTGIEAEIQDELLHGQKTAFFPFAVATFWPDDADVQPDVYTLNKQNMQAERYIPENYYRYLPDIYAGADGKIYTRSEDTELSLNESDSIGLQLTVTNGELEVVPAISSCGADNVNRLKDVSNLDIDVFEIPLQAFVSNYLS